MSNIVSATGLKNKVSEVLNDAYFKGKVTIVERYGKPIAKVIPVEAAPYRTFSDEEIKSWIRDDQIDTKLLTKINKKFSIK